MATVDKAAIAAAFGRAAGCYQQHDVLQRQSASALLSSLPVRTFARVLDAGCGPGAMSRFWRSTGSRVTALDLSSEMLAQASRERAAHHYVEADIEAIPLSDSEYDLVWSNLAVQWCESFPQAIRELYRVLRPGGCLAFSTLTADSLPEVHQAWREVDNQPHANRFLPQHELETVLNAYDGRGQGHIFRLSFDNARSAMRSLKGTGATHLHAGRTTRTLTRSRLSQLELAWPKYEGCCSLTYHVFTGVIYRD